MAHLTRYSGWLALLFALTGVCTIASADTVIVYDASNSMWGQIEGEAKVTIAHRVLSDLVTEWDESEPLGLVAYGHRREGDCSDIETVVPPGPVDREALLARIESIAPGGKTPLSAAVRHAAEALEYRDAPATVHPRDKVTIVAADAPADEDGDYKRVGGGDSATLVVPETAGDYEIRYLLNASGRMIASKPVRVE